MRPKILITGPGGRVGTEIVPMLREHFVLRLFDTKPIDAAGDDEVIQADISDFDQLTQACAGVEAMIHLAAVADEDDFFSRLLPANLAGVYNAYEAARQAGVAKVLFASTGQTILNYGPDTWITPDMPVRPSTIYGATKVFGEALARHYADRHRMSMICLRIGWFQGYASPLLPKYPEMWPEWCSPRDLTQLMVKSIASTIDFAIFFAVSNNAGRHWDISNSERLIGYQPQDNAAKSLQQPR
jgi:uronate dehydrogenase